MDPTVALCVGFFSGAFIVAALIFAAQAVAYKLCSYEEKGGHD